MPRPPNPERRDERQAQILAAVEALIVENGLEGLTIQGVIRKSGLSAGVVYHHFKNKDSILEALVARQNRGTDKLIDALQQGYTTCDVLSYAAPEMLATLCAPQSARLNVELAFRAKSGATWAHMLRDSDAKLAHALHGAISADIRRGKLPASVNPDACVELLFALWEGLVSRAAQGSLPTQEILLPSYLAAIKGILT